MQPGDSQSETKAQSEKDRTDAISQFPETDAQVMIHLSPTKREKENTMSREKRVAANELWSIPFSQNPRSKKDQTGGDRNKASRQKPVEVAG